MEDDAFACFDDDSDGDSSPSLEKNQRDPSCGVLAFHAGTEQALLQHVQSNVAESNAGSLDASGVLESIDEFCMRRHWMMHVGPKKAPILQDFIEKCCSHKSSDKQLIFVELGTYTGYSSIMISKKLRDLNRDFHFYSVEVVKDNAQIAMELVRLAGLQDYISILLLDPEKEVLSSLLDRKLRANSPENAAIDFLFIDHDKSLYLSDLQQLERDCFIQKGCYVAADNVVFARIDEYRDYIQKLKAEGVVMSRLVDSWLEYCEPDFVGDTNKNDLMKDGVGKLAEHFF